MGSSGAERKEYKRREEKKYGILLSSLPDPVQIMPYLVDSWMINPESVLLFAVISKSPV